MITAYYLKSNYKQVDIFAITATIWYKMCNFAPIIRHKA